jgi:hypothetical protein
VTDAAAVKSGGAATHNENGYHHEVHEDHEGRNVFKT